LHTYLSYKKKDPVDHKSLDIEQKMVAREQKPVVADRKTAATSR
jgi:hypothetical protein